MSGSVVPLVRSVPVSGLPWLGTVCENHTHAARQGLSAGLLHCHPPYQPASKAAKSHTPAPPTLSWSLSRHVSGLQVLTTSVWLHPLAHWAEAASPAINTTCPGWTASLQPITSCHITFSRRILSEDAPRSQLKLEWLQSMRYSQRYATPCAWASQLPVPGSLLGAAFCLPCQGH